jgi:lysylphosphatidylglycerol synthetase-like protein (DUF2156 family)
MKKQIPLLLVLISGLIMVVQYFVPHPVSEFVFAYANDFVIVIGILALPIGIFSLLRNTWAKGKHDRKERIYSMATFFGFALMVITGLKRQSLESGTLFMQLFQYILVPAQATLFSMLAFYIASAAYRAFRVRTVLAAVLLVTAFVVMLRLIPLPDPLSTWNAELVRWILAVPNMAAKRAIIIGVALGAISYSMKILLGIESSYMGRD